MVWCGLQRVSGCLDDPQGTPPRVDASVFSGVLASGPISVLRTFVESFVTDRILGAFLQHVMRLTCDTDEWVPDPKEVELLSLFGLQQHVIVAIGSADNIEPWRIGQAAGFSGGTTTDESKRRANWASAASKATRHKRQILTHIAALKERLVRFRSDGGDPDPVTRKEMMEQCDFVIRHGEPNQKISAMKMKITLEGYERPIPSEIEVVGYYIAKVGPEATREGLRLLGVGNLAVFVPEVDPADVHASGLQALNGADKDFNSRLRASK